MDYALDKRYFAEQRPFSVEHHCRDRHRVIAPVQLTFALEQLRAERLASVQAIDFADSDVPKSRM